MSSVQSEWHLGSIPSGEPEKGSGGFVALGPLQENGARLNGILEECLIAGIFIVKISIEGRDPCDMEKDLEDSSGEAIIDFHSEWTGRDL